MKSTSQETPVQGHTPGPWDAWDDDGTGTLPCVLANQVTSFGNFYVAQCNVFADARLVAAAPDLLEACEQARAALPDAWFAESNGIPRELIELLDKAIAKARGQQ